jgi:hypothetical protein
MSSLSNILVEKNEVYQKTDLTFISDNNVLGYYIRKFKQNPYRSFAAYSENIDEIYNNNIDNLIAIDGYPFQTKIKTIKPSILKKITEYEYYLDHSKFNRGYEKLYTMLRPLVLEAHSAGIFFRLATEVKRIKNLNLDEFKQFLEALPIDSLQISIGLNVIGIGLVKQLREEIPEKITIKAVGGINGYNRAKLLLENGADIIGSSVM